jgi:hypothetical protein
MNSKELNPSNITELRIKAEEQLSKKQKKEETPVLETDVKKLLHELQVHQIELEMQNEELRQANDTAEAAVKKYTMLYDFAPMGYFTLDYDGTICDLNFTGAEMLGEKRFALVNSNFKLFVADESKATFNSFFTKVYTGKTKESCELILGYDNGPMCHIYIEGILTFDDRKCLLSVVDITDLLKQHRQ